MKKIFTLLVILLIVFQLHPQTQIATSNHSVATYGHNQRKLVRDWQENIYVVYTDNTADDIIIMGLRYDQANEEWSTPQAIISGNAPTLAIDQNDKILMVYETNDPEPKIAYISTTDFITWTEPYTISFNDFTASMPVADVDSANVLNVLWIEDDYFADDSRLCYAGIIEDTLIQNKVVLERENIYDVAIANHLEYRVNDLYFAIEHFFQQVEFYHSVDYLETIELAYENNATFPCISFNSAVPSMMSEENPVRFLMINGNSSSGLNEAEIGFMGMGLIEHDLIQYQSDYLCIDNIAPPTGYSFLTWENATITHVFSYGAMWNWSTVMSEINGSGTISYPNIAYKHFNPLYIDFVWMETDNNGYKIMYKRDDKYQSIPGLQDEEAGKGFSMTGKPNPFTEFIQLKVITEKSINNQKPQLDIFNILSQKIITLTPYQDDFINTTGEIRYLFKWDGKASTGAETEAGIYLVRCTFDNKRVVRKIIYEP